VKLGAAGAVAPSGAEVCGLGSALGIAEFCARAVTQATDARARRVSGSVNLNVVIGVVASRADILLRQASKKPMHGGMSTLPLPPGCFLEVLILNDFKSLSPELVILLGLKWRFSELVILKELRAKNGRLIRMCSAFIGGV